MMQKLLRFFIPKYLHLPPSRDNISHVSTENISILGKRTAARVRAVMAYRRISVNDMVNGHDMFKELPEVFRDTALIQRIHGFVPGHFIPPLSSSMYKKGWALGLRGAEDVKIAA